MGVLTAVEAGVDVVACDWNGTLVDDRERAYAATCAVVAHRGGHLPVFDEFLADFRLPLSAHLAHYGVATEVPEAIEQWNGVMAQFRARAMPGAEVMLVALAEQGIPVAIVSAASADVLQRDMTLLGLESYISAVFDLADPKRAALEELRRRHGPAVAFVGDTEYDMAEALAVGAIAVGFTGGYRPHEALVAAGADHVVAELNLVIPALFPSGAAIQSRQLVEERGVVVTD